MQQYQQYHYGTGNSVSQEYYNQLQKWKQEERNTHVQSQSQPQLFGNSTNKTNYPQKNKTYHQYGGSSNNVFQPYDLQQKTNKNTQQWPSDLGNPPPPPPPPPPVQMAEKKILDMAKPLNVDEIKKTVNDRYFNNESEHDHEEKMKQEKATRGRTRNKPKKKKSKEKKIKKNPPRLKKKKSKTPEQMMDEWDSYEMQNKKATKKYTKKETKKSKPKLKRKKSPRPKNLLKNKNKFVGHNYKDDASSSEDSEGEKYVSRSKENAKRKKKIQKKRKAYR